MCVRRVESSRATSCVCRLRLNNSGNCCCCWFRRHRWWLARIFTCSMLTYVFVCYPFGQSKVSSEPMTRWACELPTHTNRPSCVYRIVIPMKMNGFYIARAFCMNISFVAPKLNEPWAERYQRKHSFGSFLYWFLEPIPILLHLLTFFLSTISEMVVYSQVTELIISNWCCWTSAVDSRHPKPLSQISAPMFSGRELTFLCASTWK